MTNLTKEEGKEGAYEGKEEPTNPADDLACNHLDNFLCDDFLISSVIPEGLQGNTWLDLHQSQIFFIKASKRIVKKIPT